LSRARQVGGQVPLAAKERASTAAPTFANEIWDRESSGAQRDLRAHPA
jgi:hypothetical protein